MMKKSGVTASYNGKSAWEMSQAGVGSNAHLWRVLTGRKSPSMELAKKVVAYCGTSVKKFVAFVEEQREKAVREDRGGVYIRKEDTALGALSKKLRIKNGDGPGSPLGMQRRYKKGKKIVKRREKRVEEKKREIGKK